MLFSFGGCGGVLFPSDEIDICTVGSFTVIATGFAAIDSGVGINIGFVHGFGIGENDGDWYPLFSAFVDLRLDSLRCMSCVS